MSKGLVFGKFFPPHLGHKMLIEWGARSVDELIVLVMARTDDKIPLESRVQWLKEIHKNPKIKVLGVTSDQEVDYDDLEVYKKWDAIIKYAIDYVPIDYLFTSEPKYGPICAHLLSAKHVLVDADRSLIPISGTLVRENPYKHWAYIDPVVRGYYAKRVCVLGAESTGTTTITKALADLYDTNWVPEYGRAYTIPKYREHKGWVTEDFTHIANRQLELEDEAAQNCNRILFCDTDALTTQIFHRLYIGYDSEEVNDVIRNNIQSGRYALTFLTYPDIPWEDDGLREGPEARQKEHGWFLEETVGRYEPVIPLKGSLEQRIVTAQKAIDSLGIKIITYGEYNETR